LVHAKPFEPFILETNVFNSVVGAMLSQLKESNLLHPIDFCSCKFSPAKINYDIHDKQLLTIIDAFKKWCHLLEGVQHEITIYLDHKNL
jgi:hypothetical protein